MIYAPAYLNWATSSNSSSAQTEVIIYTLSSVRLTVSFTFARSSSRTLWSLVAYFSSFLMPHISARRAGKETLKVLQSDSISCNYLFLFLFYPAMLPYFVLWGIGVKIPKELLLFTLRCCFRLLCNFFVSVQLHAFLMSNWDCCMRQTTWRMSVGKKHQRNIWQRIKMPWEALLSFVCDFFVSYMLRSVLRW